MDSGAEEPHPGLARAVALDGAVADHAMLIGSARDDVDVARQEPGSHPRWIPELKRVFAGVAEDLEVAGQLLLALGVVELDRLERGNEADGQLRLLQECRKACALPALSKGHPHAQAEPLEM
jgi:hypothetical protein